MSDQNSNFAKSALCKNCVKPRALTTPAIDNTFSENVNKVATAIRLTHIPTGIVVTCQKERSQLQNRLQAFAILRARIVEIETRKKETELANTRKSQVGTGERSEKIRTYNFPQNRVTDHRINLTLHRLDRFLEGELRGLVESLDTAVQQDILSHQKED